MAQSYGVSLAIWDHTVLPATRHKWTHPALTPAMHAGTRFISPVSNFIQALLHLSLRLFTADNNVIVWTIDQFIVDGNTVTVISRVRSTRIKLDQRSVCPELYANLLQWILRPTSRLERSNMKQGHYVIKRPPNRGIGWRNLWRKPLN